MIELPKILSDKEIGSLFYMKQSEYPAGLWLQFMELLRVVAKAQVDKLDSIKNAEFIEWLEKHGTKQQIELFKEQEGYNATYSY